MSDNQEKGWIENLQERRVLRYFISYVVVAWGLIQALDWLSKRYDLNHGIVDAALIFFIAFLPAVLLFIYYHGRPGEDAWQPVEKWAIPLNLVVALGLGGIIGMSDTSAAEPVTETVQYVNEDGEQQERLIFNRSLHNRVMLYPPKNTGADFKNAEWTGLGLMELLEVDLELDNRLYAIPPWSVTEDMKKRGIEKFDDLSFSMKRKFAADRYVDYFVDGEMTKSDDQYSVTFTAYNAMDGKAEFNKQYVNAELSAIADGFSADFNHHLYDQIDQQVEGIQFVDLPARELLTDNTDALFDYVRALQASEASDFVGQSNYLNQALEADPNFFWAKKDLGYLKFATGEATEGKVILEASMDLLEEQSERVQLGSKCRYYMTINELDKGTRLAEMWQKLYPQNEEAYQTLATFYLFTGEFGKVLDTYKAGYDNGLKGSFLLRLGELYTQREEFGEALKYLEEFQALYPEKTGEISQLGDLYLQQGDFDKAIAYFEDRTIKDDQKFSNYITLGNAYLKKGDFQKARTNYNEGLERAKITNDSVTVLVSVASLNYVEGRAEDYLEVEKNRIAMMASYLPPLAVQTQYMSFITIDRFMNCNADDFINEKLEELANIDYPDLDLGCITNYNKGLGTEDAALIQQSKERCPDDIAKSTSDIQLKLFSALENRILGNYEAALTGVEEYLKVSNAPRASFNPLIADINIKRENWDEAISLLEYYLRTDRSSAEFYILLGKAYQGDGNTSKAKEFFGRALEIWKDADPAFKPLVELKELMTEL